MSGDGRADSELSRRIGTAAADFRQLRKLWSHADVSVTDKLRFFQSLIVSRLQYGLVTMCLVTAQKRRLDGFYARCLRTILKIPAAFISRVSNASVFEKARVRPVSQQLMLQQLVLLRKIAPSPADSMLRRSTFVANTLVPQTGRYVGRVGRPRLDWSTDVMRQGVRLLGRTVFEQYLQDETPGAERRWKAKLIEMLV